MCIPKLVDLIQLLSENSARRQENNFVLLEWV